MNLPPLPLMDGCLFIDNSSWMEPMGTCHRYLQYRSLSLRVPSDDKPSLNFGSAIHLALEYRYKNYRTGPVDQKFYDDVSTMLVQHFSEHPSPLEDWRTLNWALQIVKKHNERFPTEEFNLLQDKDGKVMVELSFALPLFTYEQRHADCIQTKIPVIYCGKIDLPVSIDNQIFCMDHKTTSMMGQSFFDGKRLSSQLKGYCWAFQELTKQKVTGFIVNAIRTKAPPIYVLNDKTSNRSGKTQTKESWWQESFQRERYVLAEGALAEWKTNTIDLVEEFFWHYQRGFMPMKTEFCVRYGKCAYYDVCTMSPRRPSSDACFWSIQ